MASDYRSRPSQAIITLVMVVAVSLVVGVAVSSRVVTTLRQTSFSEQSVKALSFAEAGAEYALGCLGDGTCSVPPSVSDWLEVDGDADNDDAFYEISSLGNTEVFDFLSPIEKNKAAQIDLTGYTGNEVKIYWVDENSEGGVEEDNEAAMEISVIYCAGDCSPGGGGRYRLQRNAYDPNGGRASRSDFYIPGSPGFSTGSYPANGITYKYRVVVSLPANAKLLRLKALYNDVANSFAVAGQDASNPIPTQGAIVWSTGYYGEVRRKVEVVRTDPALSELFDFVYFSGSGSP